MNIKFFTAILALLLLGGALLYMQTLVPQSMIPVATSAEPKKITAPFPDVPFRTADGHILDVNTMPEPTILVHFWAAWCAVCSIEFPDLLTYVANSHGKVALLAVSLDDNYADSEKALHTIAVKNHISMQGAHLYWAWDKDKNISLKIFNTVKVPETIVVDEHRRMLDKIVGLGPWNEASTRQ